MPKKSSQTWLILLLSLLLLASLSWIAMDQLGRKSPSKVETTSTPEKEIPQPTPTTKEKAEEKPKPIYDTTLADLGTRPDWSVLDVWQETITREDFEYLLTKVYTAGDGWKKYITINDDHAIIRTDTRAPDATYRLNFIEEFSEVSPMRYWSSAGDLPPAPKKKPLTGLHVAIDPGHIGGDYAQIEERWFRIGDHAPVMEGEMTLKTAQILKRQLIALGAKVYLVRGKNSPVNPRKPADYRDLAVAKAAWLGREGEEEISKLQNKLFYRTGEIRERARRVNLAFRPDIVLCLHYNAEAWGDPDNPELTFNNHFHVLLHGALTDGELMHDDERFEMLVKILQRSHDEEKMLGAYIAKSLAKNTGLPAYDYPTPSTRAVKINVGNAEGLWARNLLANRLYQCPVIFPEPYLMNNKEVHQRVQLGDYKGTKLINGVERKSIFREYADAITEALLAYYLENRITYDEEQLEE